MMNAAIPPASLFSRSQRQCHLLLMLYLPEHGISLETLSHFNRVDHLCARQDITEVAAEIQRYYQLELHPDKNGYFQVHGAELGRRLCLLHWLRRALRFAPEFVQHHFIPALQQRLKTRQIETALYDKKNLQALIQYCAFRLNRDFSPQDREFLQLFMLFSLSQDNSVQFTLQQRQWLATKTEKQAAQTIVQHWQKRCCKAPDSSEIDVYTLVFCLIHTPSVSAIRYPHERHLMTHIHRLIQRFQTLAGIRFSDQSGLSHRLYSHLAPALDRCHFSIGIDDNLTTEIARLYPRLLRTTHTTLHAFAAHYRVHFSAAELGLIAIIFGAWLVQENVLQEKQLLLLTAGNPVLEAEIEHQLRELTLLPLSIKYLDVEAFCHDGAPKGISLVITPYATPLPLYSPPLIHAELPLSDHQQQYLRSLLESEYLPKTPD